MWKALRKAFSEWRTERLERRIQKMAARRAKLLEKQNRLARKFDARRNLRRDVVFGVPGIVSEENVPSPGGR